MRKKRKDYRSYQEHDAIVNKPIASLSQNTGKYKQHIVASLPNDKVCMRSRVHTSKYSQYFFDMCGDDIALHISQQGTNTIKANLIVYPAKISNGEYSLNSEFKLGKIHGDIFSLAELLGIDTSLLLDQIKRYAEKTIKAIADTAIAPTEKKKTKKIKTANGWTRI